MPLNEISKKPNLLIDLTKINEDTDIKQESSNEKLTSNSTTFLTPNYKSSNAKAPLFSPGTPHTNQLIKCSYRIPNDIERNTKLNHSIIDDLKKVWIEDIVDNEPDNDTFYSIEQLRDIEIDNYNTLKNFSKSQIDNKLSQILSKFSNKRIDVVIQNMQKQIFGFLNLDKRKLEFHSQKVELLAQLGFLYTKLVICELGLDLLTSYSSTEVNKSKYISRYKTLNINLNQSYYLLKNLIQQLENTTDFKDCAEEISDIVKKYFPDDNDFFNLSTPKK